MEKFNAWRVIAATAFAVPGCVVVATVMYFLPVSLSLWGALSGVALFKIGHGLHYKWCVLGGGVLMFGSIFAWAIRQ